MNNVPSSDQNLIASILTPEDAGTLFQFMQRVQLQGNESDIHSLLKMKLHALANGVTTCIVANKEPKEKSNETDGKDSVPVTGTKRFGSDKEAVAKH